MQLNYSLDLYVLDSAHSVWHDVQRYRTWVDAAANSVLSKARPYFLLHGIYEYLLWNNIQLVLGD